MALCQPAVEPTNQVHRSYLREGNIVRIFMRVTAIFLTIMPLLATAHRLDNLRNQRYCEIILHDQGLNFSVYNTIGLNDCPENIWNTISIDSIKKETHVMFVHLNGPRYWLIDGLKNSNNLAPTLRKLGGLRMREAAILHLSLYDIIMGVKPYTEKTVDRHTTWLFNAQKPVYELINPEGSVFVMQSYSIQKIPQTQTSLNELGSKLTLPHGWRFKTGLLTNDQEVIAINNKAIVIQDDFLNTYQQSTHDLLN